MAADGLQDPTIRQSFVNVAARAERVEDPAWLVATFVDNGIIGLVSSYNNQIIHGRRGTGKTHVLRVLETRLGALPSTITVYIDARTLGSSLMFTDLDRPLHVRCLGLFRDLISLIHNQILEWLVVNQPDRFEAAIEDLASIEKQLNYVESDAENKRIRSSKEDSSESRSGGSVGLNLQGPNASFDLTAGGGSREELEVEIQSGETPKVIIPALYQAFHQLLTHLSLAHLVILIDEWAALPADLQPYVAEFLNRVFFANPKVTVKIATLEFRSKNS